MKSEAMSELETAAIAKYESEIVELKTLETSAWEKFQAEAEPLQKKLDQLRSEWCGIRTRIFQLEELVKFAKERQL